MGTPDLKQQSIHATAVAIKERGILIVGPSGSGKSDLALRLIDRGATLISDDQVIASRQERTIVLNPPANIAGKIELYSVGIFDVPFVKDINLSMIVQLAPNSERYPLDRQTRSCLELEVPLITLDGQTSSSPIKVEMALSLIANMETQS